MHTLCARNVKKNPTRFPNCTHGCAVLATVACRVQVRNRCAILYALACQEPAATVIITRRARKARVTREAHSPLILAGTAANTAEHRPLVGKERQNARPA